MAGEEQAKIDFNGILTNIERKFDFISVNWTEEKLFEIRFRTQIERNSDDFNALCEEWVDLFSEVTSTVWVKKTSNTGPKIRFRTQYQCWTHEGKEVQKELLFDARRCNGTLDIKVLADNPQTRQKNKYIKLGLNVVVKINFNHLHKVDTLRPFSFFVHTCEPQAEVPRLVAQSNDNISQKVAEIVQKGLKTAANSVPRLPRHVRPPSTAPRLPQDVVPLSTATTPQTLTVATTPQTLTVRDLPQDVVPLSTATAPQTLTVRDFAREKVAIPRLCPQNKKGVADSRLNLETPLPPFSTTQLVPESEETAVTFNQSALPILNFDQIQLNQIIFPGTSDIKLQVQPQIQQLAQVVVTAPQLEVATESLLMCQSTLMFNSAHVLPVTTHVTTTHHFVQVHSHTVSHQSGQFL